MTGALTMLLDALQHSPVLVQAICGQGQTGNGGGEVNPGSEGLPEVGETRTIAFPFSKNGKSLRFLFLKHENEHLPIFR